MLQATYITVAHRQPARPPLAAAQAPRKATALERLGTIAAELRRQDNRLTAAGALVCACTLHPRLYLQYLDGN
jgi:hypothetical protein